MDEADDDHILDIGKKCVA